jgi:hypothetical protein
LLLLSLLFILMVLGTMRHWSNGFIVALLYARYYASNLTGEESELLLLVPSSMARLVGGAVLPLLGAVPDGGRPARLLFKMETSISIDAS